MIPIKKLVIIAPIISLTACASVQETHAPDGRKAYALNCSGAARGWDKCHTAAGNICGDKGYDIVDQTSEDVASGSGGAGGGTALFQFSKSNERSMLIACKR